MSHDESVCAAPISISSSCRRRAGITRSSLEGLEGRESTSPTRVMNTPSVVSAADVQGLSVEENPVHLSAGVNAELS